MPSSLRLLREANVYSYPIYVVFVLLAAYLLNQLDRYTLSIVAKPLAQDLKFGDKSCLANSTNPFYDELGENFKDKCPKPTKYEQCVNYNFNVSCNTSTTNNHAVCNTTHGCKWDYDGTGLLYQVVAGPIFILVYTIAGIPLGLAADRYNRVRLLTISILVWSAATATSGLSTAYWNLALSRMGMAIGQAGCTPLAASIIADYFPENYRAAAIGIYNFGIYTGYSMSFAIGNRVEIALSWRWAFYIAAMPGAIVALILILTVKEPIRGQSEQVSDKKKPVLRMPLKERIFGLMRTFLLSPSMLLLCIAGGIRNGGGYVWATNTELFFENVKDQSSGQISVYMSWIPLVGGSLGVLFGGIISDQIVKKSGPHGRVWVLVISQLAAAPFAVGALFLNPPWCYLSLIPSNVIGEMWVSVTMTVVLELVPVYLRTSCVAVYFFIITNIGGNVNPLVTVIKNGFGGTHEDFKFALLIMYPGLYVLGGLLFLLTILVLKWDLKRARAIESERMSLVDNKRNDSCDSTDEGTLVQA